MFKIGIFAEKSQCTVNMLFTAMDGSEMPGVIREINGDSITVDFNHPLAGQTVHFDIEVLEIDPALEA